MATSLLIPTFSIRVGASVHSIELAADGRRVAVASEKGVFVYDHQGQRKFAFYAQELPFTAVALTPNGGTLMAIAREGYLYAFDLLRDLSAVPYETLRLFSAPRDLRALSITPDGRRIAVGHVGQRITLLDREGKVVWNWQPQFKTWHVALAASGKRLVVASLGSPVNGIYLLDGETGEPSPNPFRTGQRVTAIALLPGEGGVVAAFSGGEYDNALFLLSPDLKERLWAYDMPCVVTDLAVDGEGRYLAAGGNDGQLYFFDFHARALIAQHGPLSGPVSGVALTPNGQHLGVASGEHVHLLRNELLAMA